MDLNDFEGIAKLSPPVALGLALMVAGAFLKQSPVQRWLIPWILMVAGAVLFPLIAEVGKVSYTVRFPDAFNAVIGVCIGGFSVGMHQGVKQAIDFFAAKKADGLPKGDTNFWKRSPDATKPVSAGNAPLSHPIQPTDVPIPPP